MEIRPYRPDDRAAIEAMAQAVVEAGQAFVFESVDDTLAYWFGSHTQTFVACVDGEVAGTYAIKPNQPGRGAHVANAGYMVADAFGGRGIGRALGEHSIETAREQGFRAMQFNMVVATNAAAVHLWRELGFSVVGTLPRVFRHQTLGLVDALVMWREL